MSWFERLFLRRRLYGDLSEELQVHLEEKIEELVASGMPKEEAAHVARREFGNVELVKESAHDVWGWRWLEDLMEDLRFGVRMLRKSPGLTLVAVLTTALGIAANVSVFSFVDGLFLRGVPAKNPERLVRIVAPENEGLFSIPEYAYLRDHTKRVEELTAHYSSAPLYISANSETGEVQAAVVSSSYFAMFGLQPYLGRFFTPEEDAVPDRDAVAVLGYGLWQRIYRGDSGILGKTLLINGHSFEIIGIMPPSFHGVEIGGMPNEIWIPAMMIRVGYRYCDGFQPSCTVLQLMGRLKPKTNISEARAEIATLMGQLGTSASGFDERRGGFGHASDRNFRRPRIFPFAHPAADHDWGTVTSDRMRKSRRTSGRAGDGSRSRNCDAPRTRRWTRTHCASTSHREPVACLRRRRLGTADFSLD